jgi:hypothetical protein
MRSRLSDEYDAPPGESDFPESLTWRILLESSPSWGQGGDLDKSVVGIEHLAAGEQAPVSISPSEDRDIRGLGFMCKWKLSEGHSDSES